MIAVETETTNESTKQLPAIRASDDRHIYTAKKC